MPTCHAVLSLAKKHKVEMPISQMLHRVLYEGVPPMKGIAELMARELKSE
jgi:glycerol-3-phosphate dehydrogenase (NAD(P)+)